MRFEGCLSCYKAQSKLRAGLIGQMAVGSHSLLLACRAHWIPLICLGRGQRGTDGSSDRFIRRLRHVLALQSAATLRRWFCLEFMLGRLNPLLRISVCRFTLALAPSQWGKLFCCRESIVSLLSLINSKPSPRGF